MPSVQEAWPLCSELSSLGAAASEEGEQNLQSFSLGQGSAGVEAFASGLNVSLPPEMTGPSAHVTGPSALS